MKVLIVGKNSYIARRTGQWFMKKSPDVAVDYISVRDDGWKNHDFSVYDAIVYAAAIVHHKDYIPEETYDMVNAQQPYELAQLAKAAGVTQFVFLSTMGVYGQDKKLPHGNIVDANTPLTPCSFYGSSKLKGEKLLQSLDDGTFHVSVVRPANVYGKDCKGNYISGFAKIVRLLPLLPNAFASSKQGMVYVDHLAELCWLVANSDRSGVYPAQDQAAVSSFEIMCAMADCICPRKKSVHCDWLFKPFAGLSIVNKLFGGISYDEEYAKCDLGDYQFTDFATAIKECF